MELSEPLWRTSQSVIVTTGIICPHLKLLYFRPQSMPRLQYSLVQLIYLQVKITSIVVLIASNSHRQPHRRAVSSSSGLLSQPQRRHELSENSGSVQSRSRRRKVSEPLKSEAQVSPHSILWSISSCQEIGTGKPIFSLLFFCVDTPAYDCS